MSESHIVNSEIAAKFNLSDDEAMKMVRIIASILVGDSSIIKLLESLKNVFPNFDEVKLRNLALEICYKRFYPLRDYLYLKEVEEVIKGLGGEIPKDAPLYSEIYNKAIAVNSEREKREQKETKTRVETDNVSVSWESQKEEYLPIKEAIEKYPEILKQFISARPIKISDTDYPVNPTVKNWLKDYIDYLGVGSHSDYERTDYLFNSPNGSKLDQVDRNIVNAVLRSYDKGLGLPIDIQTKQIIISKLVGESNVSPQDVEPEIRGNIVNLKNKK